MTNENFFLFIGMESRIMLIPIDKLTITRKADLEKIKKFRDESITDSRLNIITLNYSLESVDPINKNNKTFIPDDKAPTAQIFNICDEFTEYACGDEKNMYFKKDDELWYDHTIIVVNNPDIKLKFTWNHIDNYINSLNIMHVGNKKINIQTIFINH